MPEKIEKYLDDNYPIIWQVVSFVLKWRLMFVVTVIFFYIKYHQQNTTIINQGDKIQSLTATNAYLLSESRSNSKIINEIPFGYWKKTVNLQTKQITMFRYNDAFYEHILMPLDLDRYHYVNKTDFTMFPYDQAKVFYDEEWELIQEYLDLKSNGKAPESINKHYTKKWTDTSGRVNKDGYTRWVFEEEGHLYVCGMTDKPVK